MAYGPGKYDKEATIVRESTNAESVLVIVLGGDRGSGFSVQSRSPVAARRLAMILHEVAAQIERGR